MSKTYNEDVHFEGGLSIGNLAMGMFVAQPQAGEVMDYSVNGINLAGEGDIIPFAQTHTAWPWHSASVSVIWTPDGEDNPTNLWDLGDASAFNIRFRRTNTSDTNISWCAWRKID